MLQRKIMVVVLGQITVVDPLPGWALVLQGGLAGILAWWWSLDPLLNTLGGLMMLDYCCGVALALNRHRFRWGVGAWGITRKAMIFAVCLVIGRAIAVHGFGDYGGKAMAIFYIANEAISIFRTFTASEIPAPSPLLDMFGRLSREAGQTPVPPADKKPTENL